MTDLQQTPIRTLIVDDEPAAVKRLTLLCRDIAELRVVGTAQSGVEALAQMAATQVDLLLLDIEMPHMNGMELASRLAEPTAPGLSPAVVFVTAYERFAVAAFGVDAVGYLLKPVDPDLLLLTVRRLAGRIRPSQAPATKSGFAPFFWVPYRNELVRVETTRMDRLSAEGDYVRLHVANMSYLMRATLQELAQQLDPSVFLRVHRSAVLRRDYICALQHDGAGAWSAVGADGTTQSVGRTYLPHVKNALGVA